MTPANPEPAGVSDDLSAAVDAFTSQTDYPLLVCTAAADDGERAGCLVGFATQCSITPPRFLVCLSKVNHTFFVSERATALAIHLLGRDQAPLARLFGSTTGDDIDKFAQLAWHPGRTGAPVLDDCAAWLEGTELDRWSVGDHEALLLRPESGGRGPAPGLLTWATAPDIQPGHPA
jgi:flavin reductase (DIM6/NTAB) family NADH-FMN oxidoreductase RutF